MLGAERLVYARIGEEQMVLRIDESVPAPALGASVRVAADENRLHWFDAGSGKRLSDA
jgi:sn-glycerol 3-phosphate transport system ATP-binding protein